MTMSKNVSFQKNNILNYKSFDGTLDLNLYKEDPYQKEFHTIIDFHNYCLKLFHLVSYNYLNILQSNLSELTGEISTVTLAYNIIQINIIDTEYTVRTYTFAKFTFVIQYHIQHKHNWKRIQTNLSFYAQ